MLQNKKCCYQLCMLKIAVAISLAACSNVPQVPASIQQIQSVAAIPEVLTIGRDEDVSVSSAYSRTVRAGTHWRYIGSIPQGDVYKPTDSTFTVEGAHVHEAYLVLRDGALIGYYLPVEETFSPLDPPVQLNFSSK